MGHNRDLKGSLKINRGRGGGGLGGLGNRITLGKDVPKQYFFRWRRYLQEMSLEGGEVAITFKSAIL